MGAVAGASTSGRDRRQRCAHAAPRGIDLYGRARKCGLGEAGGRHGGTAAVAGDAYGVIGSYIGALAGFGPRDLPPWRRAACLGFAAVSLPFQFMPLAVAASRKFAERREVDRARLRLAPGPAAVTAGARA